MTCMRVLGAYAPAGVAGRTVSNASYTYAHSITIDTLFGHNGLNQITSADDGTSVLTPTYDARGNLTAYDGQTFGYDTYNRLTSVGGTGGSMSLEYDPLGRLWETSGPSGTARYQYDGAAIIAEYNASGVMQHRWVHGPGMDEPLVRYDGSGMSNKRWLHADERGSIIAHTNTGGSRIQTNSYDAYGNPGASNAGLFQYTGQVWLEDAGVYYYKNRTYHAELGRFMQADPIGHSGGVNLYAYVGGDPVNFTDPWGLSRIDSGDGTWDCVDTPDGSVCTYIPPSTTGDSCPSGAICIDGDGINFFDPGLILPPLDIDLVDFGPGGGGDGDEGAEEKKQCGPNGEPSGFTTVPRAPGANPNLPNPYMRGPDGRLHHTPAWHDAMIESRARASNGGGILGYVFGTIGAANGVAGLGGAAPAAAAAPFAITFGSIAAIATAVAPPEPLMPSMPEPPRC